MQRHIVAGEGKDMRDAIPHLTGADNAHTLDFHEFLPLTRQCGRLGSPSLRCNGFRLDAGGIPPLTFAGERDRVKKT